jgi:D-alanyl-D-alanine carboxypeptidase
MTTKKSQFSRCFNALASLRGLSVAVALAASVSFASLAQAYTAIVIDATNGNILYQHDADKERYPASLTKMMTLYMIFDALENGTVTPDTMFSVSAHAEAMQPSELGLVEGNSISVDDSIMALMTKSANDVAATVAEGLADGSEWRFGVMMTEQARELGMSNTTFTNASGWHDDDMMSTARDMAILSLRLQSDFPQYYHLFATTSWTYQGNGQTYGSHNKLLGVVDGVDGLKTGYTRPAGWNLAASAVVDGRRIVAVVMGGETRVWRDQRMTELIGEGFIIAAELDRVVPVPGIHPMRGDNGTQFASLEPLTFDAIPQPETNEVDAATFEDLVASALNLENGEFAPEQGSGGDLPWAVQVGAFSEFENAYRALDTAETYLASIIGGHASNVVTAAESAGSTLYRARIINLSESQARAGCKELYARDLPCAVVRYSSGS